MISTSENKLLDDFLMPIFGYSVHFPPTALFVVFTQSRHFYLSVVDEVVVYSVGISALTENVQGIENQFQYRHCVTIAL